MVFNTGIFLNIFDKKSRSFNLINRNEFTDFIFLQMSHLAEIYGLLFFVNLPITINHHLVFFLHDRQKIIIYKYIILIHF